MDQTQGSWTRGSCVPEEGSPFSDGSHRQPEGSWHWGHVTGGSWLSVQQVFLFQRWKVGLGEAVYVLVGGGGSL